MPRIYTTVLNLLFILPLLRLIYSYYVHSKITKDFDFGINSTCQANSKIDSKNKFIKKTIGLLE